MKIEWLDTDWMKSHIDISIYVHIHQDIYWKSQKKSENYCEWEEKKSNERKIQVKETKKKKPCRWLGGSSKGGFHIYV